MRAFLALFPLLLAAPRAVAEEGPVEIDGIVAVVEDDIILLSEVHERAAGLVRAVRESESAGVQELQIERLLAEALDRMISDALVEQEADRRNVPEVTEEQIQLTIQGIQQREGWDDEALRTHLAQQGKTADQYKREMRIQLLTYSLISARTRGRIHPDEDELRRRHRARVRLTRGWDRFGLAQILIRIPSDASPLLVSRLRERAYEVACLAGSLSPRRGEQDEDVPPCEVLVARAGPAAGGERDFAALAREYSDDRETAENGGFIGMVGHDDLPAVLDDAVLECGLGDVVGPVRGPDGFYVLKIADEEFDLSDILIRVPPDADEATVQALEQRAQEVADEARQAEEAADQAARAAAEGRVSDSYAAQAVYRAVEVFARLVGEHSEDAAVVERGGSLGTLRHTELPESVAGALVSLGVQRIAGPVRGPDGFHVLRVNKRSISQGLQSFEEARPELEAGLMEEVMRRQQEVFIEDLRRRAYVCQSAEDWGRLPFPRCSDRFRDASAAAAAPP